MSIPLSLRASTSHRTNVWCRLGKAGNRNAIGEDTAAGREKVRGKRIEWKGKRQKAPGKRQKGPRPTDVVWLARARRAPRLTKVGRGTLAVCLVPCASCLLE